MQLSVVQANLHSLGSLTKNLAYFVFERIWDIAVEQLLLLDRLLYLLNHKPIDVIDIVIRFQLNPGKHLELQEDIGVHSSSRENLDQRI